MTYKVLFLAPSRWSSLQVSNQLLASALSESASVTYVESPGVVGLSISRFLRFLFFPRHTSLPHSSHHCVHILGFSLPFSGIPVIDLLLIFCQPFTLFRILSAISSADVLIICSPIWTPLIRLCKFFCLFSPSSPSTFTHLVDCWHTYPHLKYTILPFFSVIGSTTLLGPNRSLLHRYSLTHNFPYLTIPHGASVTLPRAFISTRVYNNDIVYAGSLTSWIDYSLLEALALAFPDSRLHIYGTLHPSSCRQMLFSLSTHTNVLFHSALPREHLHKSLSAASIGIVPYLSTDPHIMSSSPSKVMDYLSCGLYVVSTPIDYLLDHPYVTIADTTAAFISACQKYLLRQSRSDRLSRYDYASSNSWSVRSSTFLSSLSSIGK